MTNLFVVCYFISQSYTVLFIDHFANSVFWESAMGYFGVHWSLWRQRKYPHITVRKKVSEKRLFDMSIHVTELH